MDVGSGKRGLFGSTLERVLLTWTSHFAGELDWKNGERVRSGSPPGSSMLLCPQVPSKEKRTFSGSHRKIPGGGAGRPAALLNGGWEKTADTAAGIPSERERDPRAIPVPPGVKEFREEGRTGSERKRLWRQWGRTGVR